MDNYLNYRWPQGPGLQPPPVPGGPGGPPRPKKKRDRKSTRLNTSHLSSSRMASSA